jgi:RNA polymerase sigma factor (sigma-70 family)
MGLQEVHIDRQVSLIKDGPSLRFAESEAPDRSRFVVPLIRRGGNNHEVSQLTGAPLDQVAHARTELWAAAGGKSVPVHQEGSITNGEVATAADLTEQDHTVRLAQNLLDAGLLGENLQYWEGLPVIYRSAERQLPVSFSSQLVLEAFYRTRRDLRLGKTESWQAYKKVRFGKEVAKESLHTPLLDEEEAFVRALYRRTPAEKTKAMRKLSDHRDLLVNKAKPIAQDSHEAEDIVSEALLKLFNAIDNDDSAYPFDRPEQDIDLHYALVSVRNEAINRWRRQRKEAQPDPLGNDSPITHTLIEERSPETIVLEAGGIEGLEALMGRVLTPRLHEVFLMKMIDDAPDKQIAAALDIEEVTVRSHISRARGKLAHAIRERRKVSV